MTNYNDLLDKVKAFVLDYFRQHKSETYVYHDLRHTRDVVKAAQTITAYFEIKGADRFIVITSAWFHDLGYFIDRMRHEEKGADLAEEFLATQHVGKEIIQKVNGCIMATKLPQQPNNLLEEILCDADLFHFGTDSFSKRSKLLLEEYNNINNKPISKTLWRDKTVAMMEAHHYFTDYGLLYLTRTKERNILKLKQKVYHDEIITNIDMENRHKSIHHGHVKDDNVEIKDEKIEIKERPERASETMFRIASNNHSRLSHLADNKAHILITVNSIILSAVISLVLRRLTNNAYLIVPSYILLVISVTTIVFAILATRPTIPQGVFTPEEIAEKKANLLFFGNFFKMSLDSYRSAMLGVIYDRDFLYDNLIRDVYSQGLVLGRKYQLLRVAYNIFMYGLIVAVLAFLIASSIPHAAAQPLPAIDSIKALSHHIK
jgi:predicted metal-dependent HD superfamily phosphohydrolase